MTDLTVARSLWIDAPRERVWRAITDPDQIARWLLPPALGAQLVRDEGGALALSLGPMQMALAAFETLDPPRRAISRSLPDGLLTTTYTLAEERGGTLVTVTLSGFAALPPEARAERMLPAGAGWEKGLQNLSAALSGADLPFPEGYVAALSGLRRQQPAALAVERSIWIRAPRARVWRAITDAAELERWFSPGTPWVSTGQEVGDRVFVRDPATGAEMYTQVIEQLDPPGHLVTRSLPEPGAPVSTTTYLLAEESGGTRLTLTYAIYDLAASRWAELEQHAFGFGLMLLNIKAHIEGTPLPVPGGF